MNLQEITDAVDAGKTVHWCNAGYRVERNEAGPGLYLYCPSTGSVTPATTPTTKSPPIAPTLLYPESQFFLAPEPGQPGEAESAPEWASDETLRRIRSMTKRYRLSVIISTNDSNIDTRVGDPLWSALDRNHEILESVAMPQLLPPTPAAPVKRVWLLDLRATCLVDAVDAADARRAWEEGREYNYEIDQEGGILRREVYEGVEPRPDGSPGEMVYSLTGDEVRQIVYCMEASSDIFDFASDDRSDCDVAAYRSVLDKFNGSPSHDDPFAGEGEFKDFSSSMLGN